MKFHRALITGLSAILVVSAAVSRAQVPVLDSVEANLNHATTCLEHEDWSATQAYATSAIFSRPIRVAVRGDALNVTKEALTLWSQALGGQITFVESDWRCADLQVSFQVKVVSCGKAVLGLASTERTVRSWTTGSYSVHVSGSLDIALTTPDGNPASKDVQINTVLHEIGHFLGLDDTTQVNCVMGPVNLKRPVVTPQSAEIETLLDLKSRADNLVETSRILASKR